MHCDLWRPSKEGTLLRRGHVLDTPEYYGSGWWCGQKHDWKLLISKLEICFGLLAVSPRCSLTSADLRRKIPSLEEDTCLIHLNTMVLGDGEDRDRTGIIC